MMMENTATVTVIMFVMSRINKFHGTFHRLVVKHDINLRKGVAFL